MIGQKTSYSFVVSESDIAAFNNKVVHRVCSTFTLAREIEWTTRQFVIKNKAEDEEGIGTMLEIHHKSPAFIGETVVISAEVISFDKGELICKFEAKVKNLLIADGKTGQKILKKNVIGSLFSKFENSE